MQNLRDKLLKAGLVTEKQAKEAERKAVDLQSGFPATLAAAGLPDTLALSVGVAEVPPDARELQSSVQQADLRMYEDKRRRDTRQPRRRSRPPSRLATPRSRAGPERANLPGCARRDEFAPDGIDVPACRDSSRGFPNLRETLDELTSTRIRSDPAPDLLRLLGGAFPGDVPGEPGAVYDVVEHGGNSDRGWGRPSLF